MVVSYIFKTVLKLVSVLIYVVTLIAALGGKVSPTISALPSILMLTLPYLVTLTIVMSIIWLVRRKFLVGGLGILTLVLSWGAVQDVFPTNMSRTATAGRHTFKLMTYNVIHGIDQQDPNPTKNRTFQYIMDSDADLVGLQELVYWDKAEIPNYTPALRDSLRARFPYWAGSERCDLKVLSRYPVKLIREFAYTDDLMRYYALFEVQMPWGKLNWVNMHMPSYRLSSDERDVVKRIVSVKNSRQGVSEFKGSIKQKLSRTLVERERVVGELLKSVKTLKGPIIISGDFNDVPSSYCYRMLEEAGFHDAWQEVSFGPTVSFNKSGLFFRLDQVFYRGNLRPLRAERGDIKSSDHYPLMVTFEETNSNL